MDYSSFFSFSFYFFYLYQLALFLQEYFSRRNHGKTLICESLYEFDQKLKESSAMLENPLSLKKNKPIQNAIILKNTVLKGKFVGDKHKLAQFDHRIEFLLQDHIKIPKNISRINDFDLLIQPENKQSQIKMNKSNLTIEISKQLFRTVYPEKYEENKFWNLTKFSEKYKENKFSNLIKFFQFSFDITSENELILSSRKTAFVVCDLVYNLKNKIFTIENPGLITHSLSYQVSLAKLQNKLFKKKTFMMLLTTLILIEFRLWEFKNIRNLFLRIKDFLIGNKKYKRLKPLEDLNCIICMVKPREIILKPCGHLICCEQCSNMINECPICRKIINGKVIIVSESSKND
jgi:hypothetical protein